MALRCITSSFYNPTGSIQVEAESGANEDLVTDDIPPNIIDTSIKVIKMDPDLVRLLSSSEVRGVNHPRSSMLHWAYTVLMIL